MSGTLADLRRDLSIVEEAPPASPRVLWSLRAVAGLGAVLSAYLAWASLTSARIAGCSAGVFDCDAVLTSRWSSWLHVPVAFVAVSIFLSLLGALAFTGSTMPAPLRRASAAIVLALSTAAAGAAVWFIGVQVLDVRHLCPWCLAVHACSIATAVLAWRHLGATAEGLRSLGTLGFVAVGALVIGQLVVTPPAKFEVTHTGDMTDKPTLVLGNSKSKTGIAATTGEKPALTKTKPPADKPGVATSLVPPVEKPSETPQVAPPPRVGGTASTKPNGPDNSDLIVENYTPRPDPVVALKPETAPPVEKPAPNSTDLEVETRAAERPAAVPAAGPKSRLVTALSGRVKLNVYELPHVGNPEAPCVVIKLFDYTCHHCRQMHEHLHAAEARYGEQLCVVYLPVPMNKSCNSYVQGTAPVHRDACVLALYALAVNRLKPEAFPEYHYWLFGSAEPRSAEEARHRASELVGEKALKNLLNDDATPGAQIRQNVEVFGLAGAGIIPKLLFRQTTEQGRIERADDLFALLEKEFPDLKPAK